MSKKDEVEEVTGYSQEQLAEMFDRVANRHEPIKDKDGNPIGRMLVFGTGDSIKDDFDYGELFKDKPTEEDFELVKNPYGMTKEEQERGNKLKDLSNE